MQIQQLIRQNAILILIGILLMAFALRFYKIGAHGLAGDEKYSLFVSQFVTYEGNNQHDSVRKPNNPYFTPKEFWSEKSLPDFFDSIARLDTGNGALYTYSLHFWTKLFGVSDTSLRFPSLLFNLFTIILLFIFVKQHFHSKNLALLVAFLAAISPFYINYSQVARNYSMNMFFALLATHLLLQLINEEESDQKPKWKYLAYSLSVLACELCHLATFPLFIIHAIFVLMFFRKKRGYIGFILAAFISVGGVALWLKSDGGRWLIDYVSNSVKVYNQMALETPDDYLSLANPKNILKQLRYVISAMYLSIDGYPTISVFHKKTFIATILASLFVLGIYIWDLRKASNINAIKLPVFLLMLSFIPIFTLIVFAFQDGNTFRIMPRYVAYSYSFSLVLLALLIQNLFKKANIIRFPILLIWAIQFLMILKLVNNVWNDKAPRYFMSFPEPRKENPYQTSANLIIKNYAKGDTVLYPSVFVEKRGGLGMPSYSVVDAQLTNFYLPKDSEIIQRVNLNEENKIYIQKPDGSQQLIFDFEGTKYRY
ncbi:hypothetical protein Emtol_2956 [Emticicia oligotrophica DSM 17448]|uniref:Glycosyltransferase RgtA/B/C/D-like domain-containing protein n=1 Tax=Emticicia oligotrophica (strain DSM 17448 / CIP 109782 / MTCC 6937 / GPTSA100-15) TaxID=929562 RepID=A0ABN4APH2_EMTOG|nr:glycosyltransferase family 39 protein [Emticicia oligotrophica]AFK04089.1 hypothetical protein Emtol_2956 [Emticicia oligotrophica DSM 17448]